MLESRPSANLKEMRLLVLVNIQDCKKDVRISISAKIAMTKTATHHQSQVLRRPFLVRNQRPVSDGVGVISEGMDLPFMKTPHITIIVSKN